MPNLKQAQSEVIGMVGAAKALVEKVVSIMDIMTTSDLFTHNFSLNAMEFILELLKEIGVTREDLEDFLSSFLVSVVPAMEITVKAILLTNLKNMISCTVDPRIPDKYRKRHKSGGDTNSSQEYGIDINIEAIDFLDKLSINPLGDVGGQWYFGLDGVEDVYKLARADDFDAFLWFVIHKGKFPSPTRINDIGALGTVVPSDGSLLTTLEVMNNAEPNSPNVLVGNTFAYSGNDAHIISMCIDNKYDDADNIVHSTLVPTSSDWSSVNWYARRADQLGKNLGFGWDPTGFDEDTSKRSHKSKYLGKPRNYAKERAICNLQYMDQTYGSAPLTGLVNNKFRFTILPKPIVHYPNTDRGEPPWRFKRLLFNEKGEYDPNGRYTLADSDLDNSTSLYYDVNGCEITIDPISGRVDVSDPSKLIKNLVECYKGLTVFEFNYDYVMSIRLFDAKVLVHTLIESLFNTEFSIGIKAIHEEETDTIKEIIKNILESDDSEINDCFYTFDNSKYDALLRKAEERRAKQYNFGDNTKEIGVLDEVNDILSEYNDNAELHERIDILHRAITQASVIISEGVDAENKHKVEFDFVSDLIKNLVTAIVNSILAPKVVMLLEINQKIMGGSWEKFTFKELISALRQIIRNIVSELKDMILQELTKLLISKLGPILATLNGMIEIEQMADYSRILQYIIENCPFIWFRFKNVREDTKLDVVDYADIDTSVVNEDEQPSTNKC